MKKVGVNITPLACALATSASTRAFACRAAPASGVVAQAEIAATATQIVLRQRLRARHQVDVGLPEPPVPLLDQFGGATGEVAAGHGRWRKT